MMARYPFRNNGQFFSILLVIVLFAILVIRVFHLQVVRADMYRRLSVENRIRVIPVAAPRGHILDRHGEVLVCNRPSYVISIVPFKLGQMEQPIQDLARYLDMAPEEIKERVRGSEYRRFEPVKIKRDIDFKTLAVIEEHKLDLPGVIYQVEPRREYLQGRLAAHLLGAVGEISAQELKTLKGNYRQGSLVGKWGIEEKYESHLHGDDGVQYVEVSAVGREIGPFPDRPAKPVTPGSDLVLTLDLALQRVVEEALSDTVVGAVVALDPNSGEVLALASRPVFDPNLFSTVVPESTWRSLNEDPHLPLLNRAVQCTYPPGSVMKVVTAAAGLHFDVITQHSRFAPCTGAFKFGERWFGCWQSWGHGSLDLMGAMARSCDVYFYQLGLKLGLDRWSKIASQCGLGTALELDLPNEAGGLIPSRSYYDQRYGKRKWTIGVLLNLSIGQGEILVTPLQLACFMAAVANGGTVFQPRLVKEIRGSDEQKVEIKSPKARTQLPVSDGRLGIIKRSLRAVVHHAEGTGRLAAVQGVEVAGKTGTAQNPHGEDHAWFVGFAPLNDPQISVAVLIEHGGHGGTAAAPIAARIIEAYLRRGGV
jgi:penicillin-binding protein 2